MCSSWRPLTAIVVKPRFAPTCGDHGKRVKWDNTRHNLAPKAASTRRSWPDALQRTSVLSTWAVTSTTTLSASGKSSASAAITRRSSPAQPINLLLCVLKKSAACWSVTQRPGAEPSSAARSWRQCSVSSSGRGSNFGRFSWLPARPFPPRPCLPRPFPRPRPLPPWL